MPKMTISEISYSLESMSGFFGEFSLEESSNTKFISVSTLKIIIWFERYMLGYLSKWSLKVNFAENEREL